MKLIFRLCFIVLVLTNSICSYSAALYNTPSIEQIKQVEDLRTKDIKTAKKTILSLIEKTKKDNISLKIMLEYELAMVEFSEGNYEKCLSLANNLVTKFKKESLSIGMGHYLIGIVSDQTKNRENAKENYDKAIASLNKETPLFFQAELYNAIGNHYKAINKNDESIYYFNKSMEINRELKNDFNLAINLNNLAELYVRKFDYNQAETLYNELLILSEKENNLLGQALGHLNLGILFNTKRNHSKAIVQLEKGLIVAQKIKIKDIIRVYYEQLSFAQENSGDVKGALINFKKGVAYSDSIDNENTKKTLGLIEGKLKKKEDSLTIQKLENTALEDKIQKTLLKKEAQRKNLLLISGGLVLLFLSILTLIVVRNNKKRKQINSELSIEKNNVEIKNKEITDSINYAQRIQNAILADRKSIQNVFKNSFLLYLPKDIVAGDFYFFAENDSHVFYAAADCTGHGVPGALMSVVCSNALTRCVKEFNLKSPGHVLDKTNQLVIETLHKSGEFINDGMDISLLSYNKTSNSYSWAGANNPLWLIRNNELIEFAPNKQPIGYYDKTEQFFTHELNLIENDCIYIFTDGLADQFGGDKHKKFLNKRFKDTLLLNNTLEMKYQENKLVETFNKWKGNLDQIDDVCVIGIRI